MGSAAARGVVVVDRRPLERNLVRFILQENGFEVRAEAATPVDALRAVAQQRPAVVVLHENAAWEGGRPTIPQLRQALPDAKILVIAPAFGVVRVELLRDADAVLEEGIGFKDLPFVIGRLASGEATRSVSDVREPAVAASPSRPFRERWVNRFQGATAAAVVFLAFMISGAAGPPGPERLGATPVVALRQAKDSLENFRAASKDPSHDLLGLAADLAAARAAAVDAGANVSTLDADIFAVVNEVLPDVPQDVAETLLLLFDDVPGLGTSTPTPTPTQEAPTPEPSPSQEASPTPTASATVAPDEASGEESPAPEEETPSEEPSPRPTEEPSPRPTEEPSPSPTEEPSPTATQEPSPREQPPPSPTQDPSSEEPSPSPTEEPSLSPTESPTGTASATTTETATPSPPATTTTPLPSETASPTTTGTVTPSPTGTTTSPTGTTPAPTGTTMSPTGTASPTGSATADGVAVLVLPPSIGVLASAVARRRARRSRR